MNLMGLNFIWINFTAFSELLFVNKCLLYELFELEKYFNTHQKLFGSTVTQNTPKNLVFPLINMESLLQGTEHNTKELEGWGNFV